MDEHSGHSGHYRHHHSLSYRMHRWAQRHKWVFAGAVIVVVCLVLLAYWVVNRENQQQLMSVVAESQFNAGSGYRDITYQGKSYRYNNRITSILYVGLDSEGDLTRQGKYSVAPQADSITLVVLDEKKRKMTIIALNRDTMTKIRKYTLNGKDRGLLKDHLGYAYTYGDGGTVSCWNMCEAVSEFLYGVPVNYYVITNLTSMVMLSDIISPVTVTVPNDDLADWNGGYRTGAQVVIDSSNLEMFVRSRDTGVDFSNNGRMERQQAYINGAVEKIRSIVTNEPSRAWEDIQKAEKCMQTNITRSRYLDLVKVLKNTVYEKKDYYIPTGEQAVTDHDEFYPDEEALLAKVIEIFYLEK